MYVDGIKWMGMMVCSWFDICSFVDAQMENCVDQYRVHCYYGVGCSLWWAFCILYNRFLDFDFIIIICVFSFVNAYLSGDSSRGQLYHFMCGEWFVFCGLVLCWNSMRETPFDW